MRAYLVASVVFAFGGGAALAQQAAVSPIGQPMQPEASPRSETGVPAIEATPGASAPFSASANPILHVPVSGLHPGNVSFAPRIANPLADDPQAAMRGMRDFIQFNCVGCHAPNAGGGMGPALSEGRFIYGSSPANLFSASIRAAPMGCRPGARFCPSDDLGSLSPTCRASPIRRARPLDEHLANAALASRRANAGRISANAEAVEFHEPLQRRPPASGRVIGDGLCEAHNRFDHALCGRRACLSRSRVSGCGYLTPADGLMAKRILPLTHALLIVSAALSSSSRAGPDRVFRRARGGAVAETPLLETPGEGGSPSASASRPPCCSPWWSGRPSRWRASPTRPRSLI